MFYSLFARGGFNFCAEKKEKSLPDIRNSWARPKLTDSFFPVFYLWRNTVFLGWGVIAESSDWTNNCFKASAGNACQYSNVSWRCDFWLCVGIGKSPNIDMVVPGKFKKKKKKLWPVYSVLLGEGISYNNKSTSLLLVIGSSSKS